MKERFKKIMIILLLLGLWEGSYRIFEWRPWIFPAPSHVLDATLSLLHIQTHFGEPLSNHWPFSQEGMEKNVLLKNIFQSPLIVGQFVSLFRLFIGFFLSLALGLSLGFALWKWKSLNQLFGPLFLGLQILPSVCWVPLAILSFGINERSIMFVLIMGCVFSIATTFRDGLLVLPPIYWKAGLMLGAKGWKLYRYILFPASLPALASSLRQGFSFAWRSLMGAELLFVVKNHGLGFLLATGRDFSDIAQVVAVMMMMVITGSIIDHFIFSKMEARIHKRFGFT